MHGLLDIVQYIGSTLVCIYNALDVRLFPDLSVTYAQILLGIIVLSLIFTLLFGTMGMGGSIVRNSDFSSLKYNFFGYKPKHGSGSYTPHHANSTTRSGVGRFVLGKRK